MPSVLVDDVPIAYAVAGAGLPVVLLSGVGYSGWCWHAVVPRLASAYRVYTCDNRGVGLSGRSPGAYTIADLAADVCAVLAAEGLMRVALVGHSLGGFIAQELALTYPERVACLGLLATTYSGRTVIPRVEHLLQAGGARADDPLSLAKRALAGAAAPGWLERDPTMMRAILRYHMQNPLAAEAQAAQVQAGVQYDAEARVGALTCPVLVMAGEADPLVPVEQARLLAARIPGAQVVRLAGVGHLLPFEAPERVSVALSDFLQTVPVW